MVQLPSQMRSWGVAMNRPPRERVSQCATKGESFWKSLGNQAELRFGKTDSGEHEGTEGLSSSPFRPDRTRRHHHIVRDDLVGAIGEACLALRRVGEMREAAGSVHSDRLQRNEWSGHVLESSPRWLSTERTSPLQRRAQCRQLLASTRKLWTVRRVSAVKLETETTEL